MRKPLLHPLPSRRPALALLLAALLAGCAAGPDYQPPAPLANNVLPQPAAAVPSRASENAFGAAQTWRADMDLEAPWWQQLGSPGLDALIAEALQASPTLAAAQAQLRQAEELQAAQEGANQWPRADLGAGSARQHISPSAQGLPGDGRTFSLQSASVSVQYQLDVSGGNRRALQALAARTDYRRYQLAGARLDLAARIASTAITQARIAAQAEALEAIASNQVAQTDIAQERLRLGQAMPADVQALQAALEQTRASALLLRKQAEQSAHLLTLLAGRARRGPSACPRSGCKISSCPPNCRRCCRLNWCANARIFRRPKRWCALPARSMAWRWRACTRKSGSARTWAARR